MVRLFCNMVKMKRITLDDVPIQFREQVKEMLEKEQQI